MIGCKPLTEIEISQILQTLTLERDKCLFLLGIHSGFRISELTSIKLVDVIQYGLLKGSITVEKRYTKGKVSSRSIPLKDSLKNELQSYITSLPKDQIYLFESQKGSKLSRIQAWRIIKNAATSLKLPGKIATHSLRKSFADRVYKKLDKDLVKTQRALGHKSVNSTVSYLSFTNEEIDNAILNIF